MTQRVALEEFNTVPAFEADDKPRLVIRTIEEFAAIDEPGSEPLLGEDGAILIPENGDVMFYGDGGAGKTTLIVDFACHAAAGDEWLGIPVASPMRVLIVENEGPRALFRIKLKAKLDAWQGSPIEGRIRVLDDPWAAATFATDPWREALADAIAHLETDILIIGPVTAAGMLEAGTLQDVRAFHNLIGEVRLRSRRLVTFILVHHENKGGQVSGAWEGVGDSLFHVQGQGHGRTRLFMQKARWSSVHHGKALDLLWAAGESFTIVDKPELDDDTIAEQILATIGETPGVSWTNVVKATRGIGDPKRRAIRDMLFATNRILNVVKIDGVQTAIPECPERRAAHLFLADDPTVKHLRPVSDAVGTQSAAAPGAGPLMHLRPASGLKGTQDVDAADSHPAEALWEPHGANGQVDDEQRLEELARTQGAMADEDEEYPF